MLLPLPDGIGVVAPYDQSFTAALKQAVPASDRRWDAANKRWLVAQSHGRAVADLIYTFFGIQAPLPMLTVAQQTETRAIELKYLGRCKEREGGEATAFGWADGNWSVVFSEQVLRRWFEGEIDIVEPTAAVTRPTSQQTFYAVLGIKQAANEDDIRKAFRRLARQWHPDHCREPDAHEQMKAINAAFSVLNDSMRRKKYNAGLLLEARMSSVGTPPPRPAYQAAYRAPLRCGWVLAQGQAHLGRLIVSKILAWEDICRDDGTVLSTSWPAGANHFVEHWSTV